MKEARREFLRTISSAAALPTLPSISWANPEAVSRRDLGASNGEASRELRSQFPLLKESMNGQALVYLDSAATTQRPRPVLDALSEFYLHENANPSKSLHTLARRSAALYDTARATVARFLNARGPEEIVWTRGTTEAINLVAASCGGTNLGPGDEVLVTLSDHYSNLLPWQLATKRTKARLRILDVDGEGRLPLDQMSLLLSKRTKLVTFPHVSNVLGRINPAKEICEIAHRAGAMVLVDAAQSVPHFPVDVTGPRLRFSGAFGTQNVRADGNRSIVGPPGPPRRDAAFQSGSNMAHEVDIELAPTRFADGALKFEAGTPNVPGAVGLAAAIAFLESYDRKVLWAQEQELTRYALASFQRINGLRLLGPQEASKRISVFPQAA
jgi:cysteine desulfurase / selenocysteine lyase